MTAIDPGSSRVLVCSFPKAGTYFLAEILTARGFRSTHFHISKREYSDYGSGSREAHRRHPEQFRVEKDLAESLALIRPGEFGVGHLPCDEEVLRAAGDFRVVFLYRDLRDCVISYMRFLAETGRDNSAAMEWIQETGPARLIAFLKLYSWFFEVAGAMLGWLTNPQAVSVSYEALAGDSGRDEQLASVMRICQHVGRRTDGEGAARIVEAALNKETLTWSGGRTRRSEFWSPQAEEIFVARGGAAVNQALGYL